MQLSGSPDLARALERGDQAQHALASADRKDRAHELSRAIAAARDLRLCVGVVGQTKRGKSTLINGLLGRPDDAVAPIGKFPTTNVISRFAYAQREEARVHLVSEPDGSPGQGIPLAEIRHYVCEDLNPQNQKGVKSVDVLAPFAGLEPNVVLTDTPGADNALSSVHDAVLLEFMPQADAVIFLVTADEPLTESEMQMLRHVRRNDVRKLFFAINKADRVGPRELNQGLEHNRTMLASLGFHDAPLFCISARTYYQTGRDSGTEQLLAAVREAIAVERANVIAERLNAVTDRFVGETRAELVSELALLEKTDAEVRNEQENLARMRRAAADAAPGMESEFGAAWKSAFDALEAALAAARSQMLSEYDDLVTRTPDSALNALARTVHTDIARRLDELTAAPCEEWQRRIEAAVKVMQADYRRAMDLPGGTPDPLKTQQDVWMDTGSIAMAGLPSLAGAVVAGALPALVNLVVPGFAGWLGGALVIPLAWVGAPVFVGVAAWKVFAAWKHQVAADRNRLALAVKKLISDLYSAIGNEVAKLRVGDKAILQQFADLHRRTLDEYDTRLRELTARRATPGYIEGLRHQVQVLNAVFPPKQLASGIPAPARAESGVERA